MKKIIIFILLAAVGAGIYAFKTYDLHDILVKARAMEDHDRSAQIQFRVGQVYWLRSEYGNAADAFTKLLTQYPTCQYAPTALYRLADSEQAMRRFPEAREAYTLLLEYYPNSEHKKMAEQRYEAIKFLNGEEVTNNLGDAFTQVVWEEVKR